MHKIRTMPNMNKIPKEHTNKTPKVDGTPDSAVGCGEGVVVFVANNSHKNKNSIDISYSISCSVGGVTKTIIN